MSEGYVYVLSNESMPDILKIGRSKHGGRVRAKALHKGVTGVPTPFKMEFEIWSDDCVNCEVDIHEELQVERVSPDREFFRIGVPEAVEAVMRVVGYDWNLSVNVSDLVLDLSDVCTSENIKIIESAFPKVPIDIALMTALRYGFRDLDIRPAIDHYNREIEERKKRSRRESGQKLESVQ